MRLILPLLLACAVLAISGCSSKTPSANEQSPKPAASAAPSATGGATASDAVEQATITVDSLPEEVCAHFINLLRADQVEQAERFMTQRALAQIRASELELSAPGGPEATYRYQPAEFGSAKQEIAFVPCVVVDQGATEQFSMMLRRGEFGWKIAGMLLHLGDAGSDLMSFENPNDVVKIKSMLGVESPAELQAAADSTLR